MGATVYFSSVVYSLCFIYLLFSLKLKMNLSFFLVIAFIILHQTLGIIFVKYLGIKSIFISFVVIVTAASWFYLLSVVSEEKVIKCILNIAFFYCIIGLIQMFSYKVTGVYFTLNEVNHREFLGFSAPLGLSAEPSNFAIALTPAVVISLINIVKLKKLTLITLVIISVYCVTTSSLAFLAIFITISIFAMRSINNINVFSFVFICVIGVAGTNALLSNELFHTRFVDTIALFTARQFVPGEINLSSYTLYVNFNIAVDMFKHTYGMGNGLGSYQYGYDYFSSNYLVAAYRDSNPGRGTASSLFIRLIAELGFFGIILIGWFISKGRNLISSRQIDTLSIAFFVTALIVLLRMGNLFTNGTVFVFIGFYVLLTRRKLQDKHLDR
jgi:hypothetical protein